MRGAVFEKLGRTINRKEKGLISEYNECLVNKKNVETASARGISKKKLTYLFFGDEKKNKKKVGIVGRTPVLRIELLQCRQRERTYG